MEEADTTKLAGDLHVTPHKVDEDGHLVECNIEGHGLFRRIVLGPNEHVVKLREGSLQVSVLAPDLHYQPTRVYINKYEYRLARPAILTAQRRIRERDGADCPAGHESGIRRIDEVTTGGYRTWHECVECGVTVTPPCCGDTSEPELWVRARSIEWGLRQYLERLCWDDKDIDALLNHRTIGLIEKEGNG